MSQSNPNAGLINAMIDAIRLDNEIVKDHHDHHRRFVRSWQRIFALLAIVQGLLGTIIAGRAGFSNDPMDIGTAVGAGLLVVAGALSGFVAMGPGGGSKDQTNPRDLPPPPSGAADKDDDD